MLVAAADVTELGAGLTSSCRWGTFTGAAAGWEVQTLVIGEQQLM